MDTVFSALGKGLSFNKKKDASHVHLFRNGVRSHTAIGEVDNNRGTELAPSSLNFFGDDSSAVDPHTASEKLSNQITSTSSKKRKFVESKDVIDSASIEPLVKESKKRKKKKNAIDEETLDNTALDGGDGSDNDGEMILFKGGLPAGSTSKAASEADASRLSEEKKAIIEFEEIQYFRKRMGIHVTGDEIPKPLQSFESIDFTPAEHQMKNVLLTNIDASLYKEPTPIQMQAIPVMRCGRDLLAAAPTGSGKTAAYLIPTITKLKSHSTEGLRALILAPTRELSNQIFREFERLSAGKKFKVCSLSKATAHHFNEAHYDALICTPMILIHGIDDGTIDLSKVQLLIMDEADRLFDLGFLEQVDKIMAACSNTHLQRAMFSATLPENVEDLARTVLQDPIRVVIGTRNAGASTINQKLVFVGREQGKLLAIRQIIKAGLKPPVIIFLQSKERARELFQELVYDGVNVDAIHADRTQAQRDAIIKRFRLGEIWVLITTDLMARGVDFKGVNMVINYDFPQSTVDYVHRIGRTGRAGRTGEAVTLFTEDDMPGLRSIANVMKISGCEVPDWMLSMKKMGNSKRKKLVSKPMERRGISTKSKFDERKHPSKHKLKANQAKKVPSKPVAADDDDE